MCCCKRLYTEDGEEKKCEIERDKMRVHIIYMMAHA